MTTESGEVKISNIVKERIERNRQKAIILQRSKLTSHPYHNNKDATTTTLKIGGTTYKDTGGGFLLEETEEPDELEQILAEQELIIENRPVCELCTKPFGVSWLYEKFEYKCCDSCRNPEIHKLIAKTEAKDAYLLKDCDMDKREPPLKFVTQKNPHNAHWGDMKLYLLPQVEQRALEVWGTEENIEKERELREEKRVMAKSRKYEKQLKELRKGMRSSLYDRTKKASHTHEFGEETYNEDDDTYYRKCTTCPYEETFEKM
ncbi:unnamed protein product [Phyllotreta striolata]|uniref:XPA C-terminal domain-containing protein n=1 Tax=Phyllotreta striolata TaxID=444603 RepID=A0A9N9XLJ1_PHYSR|nr:unnamed protein product [Phyllotreta striolata]